MKTLDKGRSEFLAILELPLVRRLVEGDWDTPQFEFVLQYVSGSEGTKGQLRFFKPFELPGTEQFCEDSGLWWSGPGGNKSDRDEVRGFLQGHLEGRFDQIETMDQAEAEAFATQFREVFGLTPEQFQLYLAYALAHLRTPWNQLVLHVEDQYQELVQRATGFDSAFIAKELLSPRSSLQRVGLVTTGVGFLNHSSIAGVTVQDFGVEAFEKRQIGQLGLNHTEPLPCPEFSLNSFPITPLQQRLLTTLLQRKGKAAILFYGAPGTGKTTLTGVLARELGFQGRQFLPENDLPSDLNEVLVVSRLLSRQNGFLVVDEADEFLGTKSGPFQSRVDKGTLNRLFDDLEGPVVFIANHVDRLDASTARRFDLVIRFEEPSQEQLVALWKQEMDRQMLPSGAWSPGQIRALAQRFKSNLGVVSQACQLIWELPEEVQMEFGPEKVLEAVMGAQLRLTSNRRPDSARKSSALYDVECLNTSVPVAQLVDIARRWHQKPERSGLKYLLHGITGGGKSALARHLAEELGIPVLVKQASDLLAPLVGQTEQLIREAFDEAQRTESLLVIDEVDTFLGGRGAGKRSWENSMVNEFLTNIESFEGFLVVSTNLMEVLDVALLRRFTVKVELRAMTSEATIRLFRRYFPELDSSVATTLQGLTPGDFGSVKSQQELYPELDVLSTLRSEAKARKVQLGHGRTIGFDN